MKVNARAGVFGSFAITQCAEWLNWHNLINKGKKEAALKMWWHPGRWSIINSCHATAVEVGRAQNWSLVYRFASCDCSRKERQRRYRCWWIDDFHHVTAVEVARTEILSLVYRFPSRECSQLRRAKILPVVYWFASYDCSRCSESGDFVADVSISIMWLQSIWREL